MVFRNLQDSEFVGRRQTLGELHRRALDADRGYAQGVLLSGPPGIGKTELLNQLFAHLFWKQDEVVPFLYTVNEAVLSAADFSRDYITHFLRQRLAFEYKEQALLSIEGLSIRELTKYAEQRKAIWAVEMLERCSHSLDEPVDALRTALNAPLLSVLATGKPVAILIDEFHRLAHLHRAGRPDPHLVCLFEAPLLSPRTPHIIAGSTAEILEMRLPVLARLSVDPLSHDESVLVIHKVLQRRGIAADTAPPLGLLDRAGGNPLYLRAIAAVIEAAVAPRVEDYWTAYLQEIEGGSIAARCSSMLKRSCSDPAQRKQALEMYLALLESSASLAGGQPARTACPTGQPVEGILEALSRAGLVCGEFGVYRLSDDRVLRDALEFLCLREILGKSRREIESMFRERWSETHREKVSFDLVLPMVREAELVAAQCLDQIGKTRHISEEAIGQLQMAVIEACINAIEHGRGGERKISVGIRIDAECMEVSVESPGRDFVPVDAGEPLARNLFSDESFRGWGVKLMKRFADEVRFERTSQGTRVILRKNLPRPSEISKEEMPRCE